MKCARLSILLDMENKRRQSQKRPVTLVTGGNDNVIAQNRKHGGGGRGVSDFYGQIKNLVPVFLSLRCQ